MHRNHINWKGNVNSKLVGIIKTVSIVDKVFLKIIEAVSVAWILLNNTEYLLSLHMKDHMHISSRRTVFHLIKVGYFEHLNICTSCYC